MSDKKAPMLRIETLFLSDSPGLDCLRLLNNELISLRIRRSTRLSHNNKEKRYVLSDLW